METQKSVLIIDDDVDLIEAMRMILEQSDYHVDAAFSTEEGLEAARRSRPDLIILDVMFGSTNDPNGFAFAVQLKHDKSLAPVPILMSTSINREYPGFNFSEKDDEFLPVDDFVNKPVDAEILLEKVGNLIAQKVSRWHDWPEPASETI